MNLIGNRANQVPTNGMLGTVAKLDKDNFVARGRVRKYPIVTKSASFTLESWEDVVICNASATINCTLPSAKANTGRVIRIKTITNFAVNSTSANVKPLGSDTAGTAILGATAGKYAELISDGAFWIVMQAN